MCWVCGGGTKAESSATTYQVGVETRSGRKHLNTPGGKIDAICLCHRTVHKFTFLSPRQKLYRSTRCYCLPPPYTSSHIVLSSPTFYKHFTKGFQNGPQFLINVSCFSAPPVGEYKDLQRHCGGGVDLLALKEMTTVKADNVLFLSLRKIKGQIYVLKIFFNFLFIYANVNPV